MRGWQNSLSARTSDAAWKLKRGLSVLNPGQRIGQGPTRRFKIQTAHLPPKIGFSECAEWAFDEAEARRIAQRCADSGEYKWVKLASMTKINGRWTRYTLESFFPLNASLCGCGDGGCNLCAVQAATH